MTNLIKSWNNRQIRIRADRYVSLTDMAQAAGKLFADWNRAKASKSYLETLSRSMGIPIDQLIQINESTGDNDSRGTWGHPKVAIRFAQWCSDEFAVQVDIWIDELLTTGVVQVKRGKQNQSLEWLAIRQQGKDERRRLTDAIKDYITRHPELSKNKAKFLYLNASEALNLGVFGQRSKQLKALLGLSEHGALRDKLTSQENSTLAALEFLACRFIDFEDLDPCLAVKKAIESSYTNQVFAQKYLQYTLPEAK